MICGHCEYLRLENDALQKVVPFVEFHLALGNEHVFDCLIVVGWVSLGDLERVWTVFVECL